MGWFQLLMLIGVWCILGTLSLAAITAVCGGRRVFSLAVAVFIIGFIARVTMIMLNEEFGFIVEKLAGNRSIWLYQHFILQRGDWGSLLGEEFALQVLVNIPAWMIFGASRLSLLFSNAAIGALAAPLAALLVNRDFKYSGSVRTLILLSLYPAGFNFSCFGLRDPLIFLGMIALCAGAIRVWANKVTIVDIGLMCCGALSVLSLRPELAYVVLLVFLMPLTSKYLDLLMASKGNKRNFSSAVLLTLPVLLIGIGAVLAGTRVAGSNIGVDTFNPADIAGDSAEDRFARHASEMGGNSHMMSAAMYQKLPWYLRVPIQTAGLIMLPFPWQVRNASLLMAFMDSIYVIGLGLFVLANAWYCDPFKKKGVGRLTMFLMAVSFVGFLGIGFVVSNFGNGFRMKLAVTPMVFLAAAIVPVRIRFRIKSRQPHSSMVPAV